LIAIVVGICGMAGGTAAIVALAVRRSLRTLSRVADEAARRDGPPAKNVFPLVGLPVELVPICIRLNELVARLDDSVQRERRFTANVAHELRTPIAELKSLSEVALKWPQDPSVAADNFRDTLEIALQMERIVATLLSLTRSEAGRQVVLKQPVVVSKTI